MIKPKNMKLSNISFGDFEQSDNLTFFERLNETAADYPRDRNIVDIFREMVSAYPDKAAIIDREIIMTYDELDKTSNQLANWLLNHNIKQETIIAICLKRSCNSIISILGILKAGAAYLPIHPDTPIERMRQMLNEAQVEVLISSSEFVRSTTEVQWLCPSLRSVVHIDSYDFFRDYERRNDLMDQSLWEFIGSSAEDEIAAGGWFNSYTGEKFTKQEMDEYAQNAFLKLAPFLNLESRVLEIGCASGITMYKIAPKVSKYVGTDLSRAIIDYNREICLRDSIGNIKLICVEAERILSVGENLFDIVIINSVIQAFSGLNYLRNIIGMAVSLLKGKGTIFIGDVMDLQKRDELIKSVREFKSRHSQAKSKINFQHELFVSEGFFEDLKVDIEGITDVHVSQKIFNIRNELTEFRYDVLISVDRSKPAKEKIEKNKLQFDWSDIKEFPANYTPVFIRPDSLSNVIFTSGTTGNPKGVMIEHRAILRTAINAKNICTRPSDIWSQTVELSFDPSTMEIFSALLNGATLCIIANELLLDVNMLKDYLEKNRITILLVITPLFHEYAEVCPKLFLTLEKIVVGGAVMSAKSANKVRALAPDIKILNAYGPTENTVVSTIFQVNGSYIQVPIGKPFSNSGVYIMDEKRMLQRPGFPGELYVFGDGIARGYLNDSKLTDEKFVPDPFYPWRRIYRTGDFARAREDGNLEFLGRIDDQVKIKGHRISLFEIEAELKAIPQIEDAIAITHEVNNKIVICVYYKPTGNISEFEIRTLLGQQLPAYMIPEYFMAMDAFPLNQHAKIDRQALPMPFHNTTRLFRNKIYEGPQNDVQRKLISIWKRILKINTISINDNFFELGGDSIKAIQFGAYSGKTDLDFEISDLFRYPNIAELSVHISAKAGLSDESRSHIVEFQSYGGGLPIFIVPGIRGRSDFYSDFAKALGLNHLVYGVQYYGAYPGEQPLSTVEEIAHFVIGCIRRKQLFGPYRLIGHSFGGIVVYEIVRQMISYGLEVEMAVVIDISIEQFNIESKMAINTWMISEAINTLSGGAITNPISAKTNADNLPNNAEKAWEIVESKIAFCNLDMNYLESAGRIFKLEYTNRNMQYYPPTVISQPILLVIAEEGSPDSMVLGWKDYAPNCKVISVRGNHFSMLENTNGKLLASSIKSFLEETGGSSQENYSIHRNSFP
jgi:amino acid adenylation domain-containing protein